MVKLVASRSKYEYLKESRFKKSGLKLPNDLMSAVRTLSAGVSAGVNLDMVDCCII